MKLLFSLSLLLTTVFAGLAQDKLETITIKTTIVCDHCMKCDDCGYNIDTSIRKAKGIKKVNINPEKNTVQVTYNSGKTTPEEI